MATQNVTVIRTGTGWTADVTACNLDPELTLKDIICLIDGQLQPASSYEKTTQTVLTWVGPALPTDTTVDIRRSTPVEVYSPVEYTNRFSSGLWNKELDRIARRAEEYALNGVGPASTVSNRLPRDDAFGATWDGDTIYPATRNAIYDKIVSMVLTEAFGATWASDSAAAPTRKAVYDRLVELAPLDSPSLTGAPTAPTPLAADNSNRIATTAYVWASVTRGANYIEFPNGVVLVYSSSLVVAPDGSGNASGTWTMPVFLNIASITSSITGGADSDVALWTEAAGANRGNQNKISYKVSRATPGSNVGFDILVIGTRP